MFQHTGPGRTSRENRIVAAYLALVAGYVNSAGFVLIGSFTSHVTGNVGRLANDVAAGQIGATATTFTMLIAFLAGSFVASGILESAFLGRTTNAYAALLMIEAVLLLLFTEAAQLTPETYPRLRDLDAAILCASMGMQNSLVTRLSGAVVRTTHLTGAFTDLGIEGARWFRWWRGKLSERIGVKLSFGDNPPERPAVPKTTLLLTIVGGFIGGAIVGAAVGERLHYAAMIFPSAAVAALGVYAYFNGAARLPDAPDDPPA
jgi:uncharacterized membrane protein YoaK (UPF0700 family)